MTSGAGQRAAIYARFSTERQDERSIDDQVIRCRHVAGERGLAVVAVYQDQAVSGAKFHRAGLARLLLSAKGRQFDVVIVDDASRLSRDLGDFSRLVFDEFPRVGVAVLDCHNGLRSDQNGARTSFNAFGFVADAFLEIVKHETHRGLAGRARAGFHTGGRCYGYRTIKEPDPINKDHPRAIVLIDEPEAATVRWVFAQVADGASPRELAEDLNRRSVPAPYDGKAYTKITGPGWGHSTVRAMLRNERYLGKFTWNKRKWSRHGPERSRIARERPAAEWITQERPELAIIEKEVWAAVQAKLVERTRLSGVTKRRPEGASSALSGLLRCGTCGTRMSANGSKTKAGVTYRNFRCSANREKGPDICPNCTQVSERKLLTAIAETVRASLGHPALVKQFEEAFSKHWNASQRARASSVESEGLSAEIRSMTAKRDRVIRALEEGAGAFTSVKDRLRELEGKLRDLHQRHAAALDAERAKALDRVERPSPSQLLAAFGDMESIFLSAPAKANKALQERLTAIVVTPRRTAEGTGFSLEMALKTKPAALVGATGLFPEVSGNVGCGARI